MRLRHAYFALMLLAVGLMQGEARAVDSAAPALRTRIAQADASVQAGSGLPAKWLETAWDNYKRQFVRAGRVLDDVNKISHSEGQGYAMLIAAKASDRAAFDEIWNWTRRELYVDPSDLAAWQWNEKSVPHVKDRNNATDGDILIAWALLEGGEKWHSAEYVEAARKIVAALGRNVVVEAAGGTALLPGRNGFSATEQPDGLVLNLSYWVFPAFERLRGIAPEIDWAAIEATGMRLIRESRFGPTRLPPEWIAVGSAGLAPAQAFPSRFSYNAIRIPLYLVWSKKAPRDVLRPFAGLWNEALDLGPFEVELPSGAALDPLGGSGFKAIVATAKCAADGQKVPTSLLRIGPGSYYSTTLHILSLMAIQERYPECL